MARGKVLVNSIYYLGQIRAQNLKYRVFCFFVDLRYTAPFRQIWHVITTVRLIGRL